MNTFSSTTTCFDAGQGASEARTEPYMKYGDGALQLATQYCAKSISGAVGFAGWQAEATGSRG